MRNLFICIPVMLLSTLHTLNKKTWKKDGALINTKDSVNYNKNVDLQKEYS